MGLKDLAELDRRYALVALERTILVASKTFVVVLLARTAGPSALGVYAVGLAVAVWAGALANFGSHLIVQSDVARNREAIARMGTAALASSMTLGALLAPAAGILHALLGPAEPAALVGLATAAIVPSIAGMQILGSLVKGNDDFVGHLWGSAARHLLFPLLVLWSHSHGSASGTGALVAYAACIWVSNVVWWARLNRTVAFRLVSPRHAAQQALVGRHGAGFQLGEAAAARVDLLVLAAIASPALVGIYALVKQVVDALMHIPRIGGAIALNDSATGRERRHQGRTVLVGLQLIASLPLLVVPGSVLTIAGGDDYVAGSASLRILALAGLLWGWSTLRAHEEFGLGRGAKATQWAASLVVLVGPLTLLGFRLGELTGVAAVTLLSYGLASIWLWQRPGGSSPR